MPTISPPPPVVIGSASGAPVEFTVLALPAINLTLNGFLNWGTGLLYDRYQILSGFIRNDTGLMHWPIAIEGNENVSGTFPWIRVWRAQETAGNLELRFFWSTTWSGVAANCTLTAFSRGQIILMRSL